LVENSVTANANAVAIKECPTINIAYTEHMKKYKQLTVYN